MVFRHRGSFVPPCFELFKPDVSAPLARKLAETYDLRSTGIVVNQTAASTQYLSFRYVLSGDPFRYLDVAIGIDQMEIAFSNAATVPELIKEVSRVWNLVIEILHPTMKDNYFEATLHCECESSTKTFLDGLVDVPTNSIDINKGFLLSTKAEKVDATARLSLEVSEVISDGLYVTFGFFSKGTIRDLATLAELFNAVLNTYRSLQALAHVEIEEPR